MDYLVIGGGIAGLVSAYRLAQLAGGENVMLLERAPEVGGLLLGSTYPGTGVQFDHGTHIFRESGHTELDRLLVGAIPEEERVLFDVADGALVGAVFDGTLHAHSHYPDIRRRTDHAEQVDAIEAHLRLLSSLPGIDPCAPLREAGIARFGAGYTDKVLMPALGNLFRTDPETLTALAMTLAGATRLVACDQAQWHERVQHDDRYRAVYATPEQRLMPAEYANPLRRYYASRSGTRALADGLQRLLREQGVRLETRATLHGLDLARTSIAWSAGDQAEIRHTRARGIVLAMGLVPTARALGVAMPPPTRRKRHVTIHLLLDAPTQSDLSYFINYDPRHAYFRVTNYRALSRRADDCRLTVELLLDDAQAIPDPALLHGQLRDIGFLSGQRIVFSDSKELPGSFPFPTQENSAALSRLHAQLAGMTLPGSVLMVGAGMASQAFFQNDVLRHAYASMDTWLEACTPA